MSESSNLENFKEIKVRPATEILGPMRREFQQLGYDEKTSSFFSTAFMNRSFGFNIFYPPNSKIDTVYQFMPDPGDIGHQLMPVLQVKTPARFIDMLARLSSIVKANSYRQNAWLDKIDTEPPHYLAMRMPLNHIWFNATYSDFDNPNQFLDRLSHMIDDDTFPDKSTWMKTTCTLPGLEMGLNYRITDAKPTMEGPHELHFVSSQTQSPTEIDEIPCVRFGKTGESEITLYAIQMPNIDNEKKVERSANIKELKDHIGKFSLGALSLSAALNIFKQAGINKVRIPTYLPLRSHYFILEHGEEKGNEIDQRILDQLLKTLNDCFPDQQVNQTYEFAAQTNDYLQLAI